MRRAIVAIGFLFAATAASAQIVKPPATQPQQSPTGTQTQQTAPASPLPPQVTVPPLFPEPPGAPRTQQPAATQQPVPAATPKKVAPGLQPFDYSVNLASEVFGAHLFTGAFASSSAALYNPDHVISIGDQLQVRLWGAFDFDALLTVDPQGNIFLPHVGPVRVASVANRELPRVLEEAVRRTFRANVHSYISLAAAQPVRVFVTGFVPRPGMYHGSSSDSVLRYLDQAGGVDPERGSFLDVQVQRGSQVRAIYNLYEFLLNGKMAPLQLGDGDVVVVQPRKNTYNVLGLAENAKRFEFLADKIDVTELIALAKPRAQATHMRIVRSSGIVRNIDYYPRGTPVTLFNGDEVEFTADVRPGTITVRVEGEHVSDQQEYVLEYGARVGDLIKQVKFTERSDSGNLQLFRLSVKARQKLALQASLKNLEVAVLTARSGTAEEARLRADEAQLMLQWVERARTIEPLGQVVVAQTRQRDDLLLENGDIFRVPTKDGLVLVAGEVMFPNTVAHDSAYAIDDYVKRAGGYTQGADTSRIVIAHRDGSYEETLNGVVIRAGDEILVLPKVQTKTRQFMKELTQIIYNIAVSARIIFGFNR
jgi:protein involved in polysaccharide export with SLBB domain